MRFFKTYFPGFIVLLLVVAVSPVQGGGGDWKMGPFGPYWDDNSWPEFTPMYWMEEFMNRLDDDDDEIQAWMLRNQYPGQYSGTNRSGAYPGEGLQPDTWTGSGTRFAPGTYTAPNSNPPSGNTYIFGGNNPSTGESRSDSRGDSGPLPYLSPEEFARMPVELQREFRRAFDREYPIASSPEQDANRKPLPRLTRQEFARMPSELQREYKRAYEREYPQSAQQRPIPTQGRRPLPNLTPQEYARMPADLQREYKQAFDREYADYRARARDTDRYRSAPKNNWPKNSCSSKGCFFD